MEGQLLPLTSTQYNKDLSRWSHATHQKQTYAVSTVSISKQKQQFGKSSQNSLSKIILNFEDFWLKNAARSQKQNSKDAFNLDLDSMLSQQLKNYQSFNDLSVKSKTYANHDISLQSNESKQSGQLKVNSIVFIAQQKQQNYKKKFLPALQIQSKKSLNDQSFICKSVKELNFLKIESPKHNQKASQLNKNLSMEIVYSQTQTAQETKTSQDQNKQRESIQNSIQILQQLQQLTLVGYWCSLYLSPTNVRWQKLCTLLYQECYEKIKKNQINQILLYNIDSIKQKNKEYKAILENVNGMIEKKGLKYNNSTSQNLYGTILKQSQNFVGDIIKDQTMNKNYQFCLYKMIRALTILANMNGITVHCPQFINKDEQFSIKLLKNYLVVYKQLLKFTDTPKVNI